MKVKEAIEQLQKLPQDGELMVASQGHGCSVPLQGFIDLDDSGWSVNGKAVEPKQQHWIDVVYCDDNEREDYSLPPFPSTDWDAVAKSLEASGDIKIID